jgi:hypothetical protein
MLSCVHGDSAVDDEYQRVSRELLEGRAAKQKLLVLNQKFQRVEQDRLAERRWFDHELRRREEEHAQKIYEMNTVKMVDMSQLSERGRLDLQNANQKIEQLSIEHNASLQQVADLGNELKSLSGEYERERKTLILQRDDAADEQRQLLLRRALRAEAEVRRLEQEFLDNAAAAVAAEKLNKLQVKIVASPMANTLCRGRPSSSSPPPPPPPQDQDKQNQESNLKWNGSRSQQPILAKRGIIVADPSDDTVIKSNSAVVPISTATNNIITTTAAWSGSSVSSRKSVSESPIFMPLQTRRNRKSNNPPETLILSFPSPVESSLGCWTGANSPMSEFHPEDDEDYEKPAVQGVRGILLGDPSHFEKVIA